jgi:hypothetical protein
MRARPALMLLVLLVLAGCPRAGTGTTASHPTATTSIAILGKRYQALAVPVDVAGAQFASQLDHLPATDTGPQVLEVLEPYINAMKTFQQGIRATTWPAAIVPDAHTVENRVSVVIRVLQDVATQTTSTVQSWLTRLGGAITTMRVATTKLRHDVGLPPAKNPGVGSAVEASRRGMDR